MERIVQISILALLLSFTGKVYSQVIGIYSTVPLDDLDELTYIELRSDSSIFFQELPHSYGPGCKVSLISYENWTSIGDTIIFWAHTVPYYHYDWGASSAAARHKQPAEPEIIKTRILISGDTLIFLEGPHKGLQLLRIMSLQNSVEQSLVGKWKLSSTYSDTSFTFELNADGTYRHFLCKRCKRIPVYASGHYVRFSKEPFDDFSSGHWTVEKEVLIMYGKLGTTKNTELYRFRLNPKINLFVLDQEIGWNWNESFASESNKRLTKVW
ncbi:hypothetical protein JYT72_02275 [Crocinitomix catalasitica]|nr:hypothetical protein [Crocinitomix catalasitica]